MTQAAYTIEHTGTNSLCSLYPTAQQIHCTEPLDVARWDQVYTTYRDPLSTGASWGNRFARRLDDEDKIDARAIWFESWKNWADAYPSMEVINMRDLPTQENAYPDVMGLHEALAHGDMDHYYSIVPRYFIDFAAMCVGAVQ